MSRSILKSSDASKRVVPIHANEGSHEEYENITAVKPWGPIDDQPLMMNHVHQDMDTIQANLQKMHEKMMHNFPQTAPFPINPPFEPLPPPPLQALPFPDPHVLAIDQFSSSPRNGRRVDASSPHGTLQKLGPPDSGTICLTPPRLPSGFPSNNMIMTPPPPMLPPMAPPAPSPVIREDESGYRMLDLILDVKGYLPEDIHINTEGSVLFIHACRLAAKRDVRGEGDVHDARVAKECRRQYTLPEVVRAENLRCSVNANGQLTIEGPLGPDVIRTLTKKKVKFAAGRR